MATFYSQSEYDEIKRTLERKLKKQAQQLKDRDAKIAELKGLAEYWEEEYHDLYDEYNELSSTLFDVDYEAQQQADEQYAADLM